MSSVVGAVRGATDRLLGRSHEHEGYAFCAEDGYWFRPSYTEGKCPLCGKVAPGGAQAPPLLARNDRSWVAPALLALESLGMMILVLLMYFKA